MQHAAPSKHDAHTTDWFNRELKGQVGLIHRCASNSFRTSERRSERLVMSKNLRQPKSALVAVAHALTDGATPEPLNSAANVFSVDADRYIAAAVAESTKRVYATDEWHFAANGIGIPATPAQVVEYLTKFAGKLAAATLDRRLNYLNKVHVEQSFPSSTADAQVRLVLRGIRRTFGAKQRRVKALVRDDIVELLFANERQKTLKAARDKAILLVDFSGAFRRSELVGIRVEHIGRLDSGIEIELPSSKTDSDGAGRMVFIPLAVSTRCPVRAVDEWLALADIESGYVFRQVTRHDQLRSDRLTAHAVARILKRAVERTGAGSTNVSGHSLRSGFCTQAAMSDVPNWLVRETTGHTSDAVLNVYCRPVKRRKMPSLL